MRVHHMMMNGKKFMIGVHHMMRVHHMMGIHQTSRVPFLFAIRMQKFSSFWQGSLDFLRQRIRMSIEYGKQKINLAVIIIVNFHKFNFECF